MQDTRYILLVLLSSSPIPTGCSRREPLGDYSISGVDVKLDRNGVTDKLPEGARVIFYPKSMEGRKIDTYFSARGGKVRMPLGRYSVVVYNYNVETVQIRGEEAYEITEALTGYYNGLGIAGAEKMTWGPDPLYIVQIDDSHTANSEEGLLLDWKPRLMVKTYLFKIEVEGLEYVFSIVGSVEGIMGRYCLGRYCGMMCDVPICFEAQERPGKITGSFIASRMPEVTISQTSGKIKPTLASIEVDKTAQEAGTNVVEVVTSSESGGSEEGNVDEPPTEIELPLDEKVKAEKPTINPDGRGDGTGRDVDDWGDEDRVVLPVE